jgi:uncharacterized protein (DUF952 family)
MANATFTEVELKELPIAKQVALANRHYEGLSDLLMAINGQGLNSGLVGEGTLADTLFPHAG